MLWINRYEPHHFSKKKVLVFSLSNHVDGTVEVKSMGQSTEVGQLQ